MRRPARYVAVLALLLFTGGLSASPLASGHPTHLLIANDIVGSNEQVNLNRWVAQSFVTGSSFFITRVAMWVADTGTSDSLNVSIRSDAGGSPGSTNLTWGLADGPGGPGWVDFDLNPYVELVASTTYWIVAHSDRTGSGGYDWWNSNDDLAYGPGTAATSSDGIAWSGAGKDYSFRVYGLVQPSFSFSVGVSDPVLRTGRNDVFTVNFTNSGSGSSADLWVNVSFPASLSYVSDDAAAIGGTRTGTSFRFTDIAPGVYTFNVTITPTGGTLDGTVAVTTFTFDAKDHLGAFLLQPQLGVTTTIRSALLSIALEQSALSGDPGDTITVNATISNVGGETASVILFEAPIDPNATYVSSSLPATYDVGTRTVLRAVPDLDPGNSVAVNWTIRLNVGAPDLARIVSDTIATYLDPTGTPLPRELASLVAYAQVPVFNPVLLLDRIAAERAEEVVATLYYNNTGSMAAPVAQATWGLGGHYELLGLAPAFSMVPRPGGFVVEFTDVSPGAHVLFARLKVLRSLDDGLLMPLHVVWNATDGNLNPFLSQPIQDIVALDAPQVVVTIVAPERVPTEAIFVLTATLRNMGNAPAVAWLNLTVPNTVDLVGDNGTQAPNVAGSRVSWMFRSIPGGGVVFFGISLRGKATSSVESFRLSLDYTDGAGSVPLTVFSNALPVEFTAPSVQPPTVYIGWILLAALGIADAAVLVAWRRRGPAAIVNEVFVADLSGVLLAHRSAGAVARQDEDVLIAMFKVVQDFVRDAFSEAADEVMSALEFGERKILLERGKHHFIAVIYRGLDRHGNLSARVKHVSQEIDEKFGPILETWSGELETVRGIALLLPQIWRRRRFPISTRGRAKPRADHASEASSPSPPNSGSP